MAASKTRRTKTGKEATQLLNVVSQMTPETLQGDVEEFSNQMAALGSGMGGACSTLLMKVQTLNDAIAIKEARLTELYDIEHDCLAHADVQAQHEEASEQFQREVTTRNQQWSDEAERHLAEIRRRDAEAAYDHTQQLARFQTEYEATCEENKRREMMRQQDLQRDWDARNAEIAESENELEALRAEHDQLGDKLAEAVQEAHDDAKAAADRDHQHALASVKSQCDTEVKLAKAQLSNANARCDAADAQIEALQAQLAQAHDDAKAITQAALESASGRQALSEVQAAAASTSGGKR